MASVSRAPSPRSVTACAGSASHALAAAQSPPRYALVILGPAFSRCSRYQAVTKLLPSCYRTYPCTIGYSYSLLGSYISQVNFRTVRARRGPRVLRAHCYSFSASCLRHCGCSVGPPPPRRVASGRSLLRYCYTPLYTVIHRYTTQHVASGRPFSFVTGHTVTYRDHAVTTYRYHAVTTYRHHSIPSPYRHHTVTMPLPCRYHSIPLPYRHHTLFSIP